jgi:nucleoid DNA-binding protein
MNREKLIKHITKNTNCDKDDVERIINELEFTIIKTIASGENIKMFPGFELKAIIVPEHYYKNPHTGELATTPATIQCRLHTTKLFREKVGICCDQNK